MKKLPNKLLAALLFTFPSVDALAKPPTAVMSCKGLEIYEAGAFKPADLSVTVVASDEKPQSFKAIIVTGGRTLEERDVEMRARKAADARELKELSETVLPGLKWHRVYSVRAANIMAAANREDGSGILLIELFDKKQNLLGKIVEIGWGFGRCK